MQTIEGISQNRELDEWLHQFVFHQTGTAPLYSFRPELAMEVLRACVAESRRREDTLFFLSTSYDVTLGVWGGLSSSGATMEEAICRFARRYFTPMAVL